MCRIPENWVFGYNPKSIRDKWIESKLNKGFLHYCFAKFDDFSKFHIAFGAHQFEKSSNMAKIWQEMKEYLVQLAFYPFLHSTAGIKYPGLGYPRSATNENLLFIFLYLFI